jgi:ferredoxin
MIPIKNEKDGQVILPCVCGATGLLDCDMYPRELVSDGSSLSCRVAILCSHCHRLLASGFGDVSLHRYYPAEGET